MGYNSSLIGSKYSRGHKKNHRYTVVVMLPVGVGINPKHRTISGLESLIPTRNFSHSTKDPLPYYENEKVLKPRINEKKDIKYILKSTIRSIRWVHLLILFIIWVLVVYHYERTVPYNTIKSCQWDHWEDWKTDGKITPDPHRAIIIGDPQIIDDYSYPNRTKSMLAITKRITDNFLHRNHVIYQRVLNPHSTLYIGDLFDGGRDWEDNVWFDEYRRFHKVFSTPPSSRMYFEIPGNHDIGFGNAVSLDVLNRFRTYFGEANDYRILGNHSFVLLDSISMSAFENPLINEEPARFVTELSDPDHPSKEYPRVLLSHVPLWRFTDKQFCGPLRESKKKFPVMRGKQYQTVLEFELSQNLMNFIKPKLIFSGDDHDYCHVRHPLNKVPGNGGEGSGAGDGFSDEITVKSSAMTGGVKKPAIQLISLWNPTDEEERSHIKVNSEIQDTGDLISKYDTIQTRLCYLPDAYYALKIYAFTFVLSVSSLAFIILFSKQAHRLENFYKKKLNKVFREDTYIPLTASKSDNWVPQENKQKKTFLYRILSKDWKIPEERNFKSLALNVLILGVFVIKLITSYYDSI